MPAKRGAVAAALMARRAAGPEMPPPFSEVSCRAATVSATARAVSRSMRSWMPSRLREAYPSVAHGRRRSACARTGWPGRPGRWAGGRCARPGCGGSGWCRSARAGRRGWPRRAARGWLPPGSPRRRSPRSAAEHGRLQGAGARPGAQVVGVVVEQQVPVGDHALQDADGVDDRGDGDPGNLALGPPDSWLPSSSVAALNSRPRIRCRPACPSGPGPGRGSIRCATPGSHPGACRSGRRRR